MDHTLILEPLTPRGFAPFGDVFDLRPEVGLYRNITRLENLRPAASADLIVLTVAESRLPLQITAMEIHLHSSQTFIPIKASRTPVVVAPKDVDGMPDVTAARAFMANDRQGFTLKPGTWHGQLTALDQVSSFAVLMWGDGSSEDGIVSPLSRSMRIIDSVN
ncbi:MAG: ureidoglycolate lyase [Sphingomonadales bacterium]|nr:ureidoglycolate lyase [Sphingomonadales bacterium]